MHLILYDGTCGLCNRVVRAVVGRDRRRLFRFASLQGRVARERLAGFTLDPAGSDTFLVIRDFERGTSGPLLRARAALFVATELGWPWRAASVLRLLPMVWLDRAYDVVARHRHRFFGRSDRCERPRPNQRDRFLDADPG